MEKIIRESIIGHKETLGFLEDISKVIEEIATLFLVTLKNKGKLIFMGNGGSAADAQHLAAEFVGRFRKERIALPALSLTTDTSILTAIGNDFGFEKGFVRQVEALANPVDLIVGISTSGNSLNVIKALEKAKKIGVKTVCFLGKDGGALRSIADVSLIIPSFDTPRVQEMHILAGHIICEIVEEKFFTASCS
jgi:D-sedoheptulose 7-phosphate isomerase